MMTHPPQPKQLLHWPRVVSDRTWALCGSVLGTITWSRPQVNCSRCIQMLGSALKAD